MPDNPQQGVIIIGKATREPIVFQEVINPTIRSLNFEGKTVTNVSTTFCLEQGYWSATLLWEKKRQ